MISVKSYHLVQDMAGRILRGMTAFIRSLLAGSSLASMACATAQPSSHDSVAVLIEHSQQANDALMRGEIDRYCALVTYDADFSLMSPFGGKPTLGALSPERMVKLGRFFKNGTLRQEVVQTYSSPDMIVLATIEHANGVEVGGLPAQNWALRVTLVYRRVGSQWRLVHRHADPLAHGISLEHAAALGRGEPTASASR